MHGVTTGWRPAKRLLLLLGCSIAVLVGLRWWFNTVDSELAAGGGVIVGSREQLRRRAGERRLGTVAPARVERTCTRPGLPTSDADGATTECASFTEPVNANVTARVISLTLVNKVAGPAVAVVLACPLWRLEGRRQETRDARYVANTLLVSVAGVVDGVVLASDGGRAPPKRERLASFEAADTVVDWERLFEHLGNYGSVSLLAVIPRTALTEAGWAHASSFEATLTVTLTTTMELDPSPRTNVTYQHRSVFAQVPVGLPIGVASPDAWARLVRRQQHTTVHAPELRVCYGPLWSVGDDPGHFFAYVAELVEYHRSVGARQIVFYWTSAPDTVQPYVDLLLDRFRAYPDLVTWTFADELDTSVDGYYHNQRALIADCVHQQSGAFGFLWVADVDEWLWVTHPGSIEGDLQRLWDRRGAGDVSMFAFKTHEDYVQLTHSCPRSHPNETLTDATARLHRPDRSKLMMARWPFFATNFSPPMAGDARIKTLSLTGYIRSATAHYGSGGEVCRHSAGEILAGSVVKLHARGLPFELPKCVDWGRDRVGGRFVDGWTHEVYPSSVRTLEFDLTGYTPPPSTDWP